MGRRYYCDYCDKTFIDDLGARKKHLLGATHQRVRKLHYDQFKDPYQFVNEESSKQPCNKFMQTGECKFGDFCKFTHFRPEELERYRFEVDQYMFSKIGKQVEVPTVESWLEKYSRKTIDEKSNHKIVSVPWTYPEELSARPDLPPSLLKFKPEQFEDDHFETWG